jgi:hypothetical protein
MILRTIYKRVQIRMAKIGYDVLMVLVMLQHYALLHI